MPQPTNLIKASWPAPSHIQAYHTLRMGGVSLAPYDEFNLAQHVGDNEKHVDQNRSTLAHILSLPNEPIWLEQTHSTIVIPALPQNRGKEADAAYTDQTSQVCVVLTADCLPIFLCDTAGTKVAAIHAGWRGLANGIIKNTLSEFNKSNSEILVWLGPAIGPQAFEVGPEVKDLFLQMNTEAERAFMPSPNGRWLANIYELAKIQFAALGITKIYGGTYCTYSDRKQFYSYRRDGNKTGRLASLIWIQDQLGI